MNNDRPKLLDTIIRLFGYNSSVRIPLIGGVQCGNPMQKLICGCKVCGGKRSSEVFDWFSYIGKIGGDNDF